MQNGFSLFIQLKLNFWSHFMVFLFFCFFFGFSRCMVTSLRNHLNFQNSFVSDKHQHDFYFYTKLWILKKSLWTCAIMHCFGKKRETHQKILGAMASCLKIMLYVLFAWDNNKIKACHEHKKTLDLINKKALLTKKVLLHYELTNKTETDWNKNQEAL